MFLTTLLSLVLSQASAAPVEGTAAAAARNPYAAKTKTKLTAPSWNSPRQAPVSLTPSLGANYMSIRGIKELSSTPDTGMSLSVLAEVQTPANKNLFLQTGLMYNQFGSKFGDEAIAPGVSIRGIRINLTYLNVPLIAKYNIVSTDQNSVYIKAGILPGVVVAKEIRGSLNGFTLSQSAIPELKQYDVPFTLGGGMRIPFQKEYGLTVDAAYVRSIFDTVGNTNAKNDGFVASVGVNVAL